ncbi:CMGC/SRPK protein kinase [Sporothrix schenckii ATCC 58251]|uniref:non-specific serine/threonine protein kinase n=1 Tax=Sporothrix schenckii (strain ATCC 58251 / de Perez 2211183) TaxID=1391915 RepID=U7PSG1_SPOS1|nr:CMGC/SRPK protein kinase [Sporothrix schenckii ATCC 58251]
MSSSSSPPRPPATTPAAKGCRPRVFPTNGFELIDPGQLVEEERLPTYDRAAYYPMHLGDIVGGHFQVVAKLGYGTTSTVWLARDLNKERVFKALKVHTHTAPFHHELSIYEHLQKPIEQEMEENHPHPGRDHVRQLDTMFFIDGPHGRHAVFVMAPLGMSLATMQAMHRTHVFPPAMVAKAVSQTLLGLALLHGGGIVHTDLHADNLLVAMTDDAILSKMEDSEAANKPSARKVVDRDTTIYTSRYVLGGAGPLTISDLGQASIGRELAGHAMPTQYRAPEVILGMIWGMSVDIWSTGLLVRRYNLFDVYDKESPELNNAHHLAALTALLGPPPKAFVERSSACAQYWDADGHWHGPVPLPPAKPLADRVTADVGDAKQKALFVDCLECFLQWLPDERLKAAQIYFHPWLRGFDEV